MEEKGLQTREKHQVQASAEQTKPGPVFSPTVDIFENDKQIVLLADMPGVNPKDLDIDLRDDVLTLAGEISPFEGANEQVVSVEYEVGKYYRQFTLSEVIDQEAIEAKLDKGVLRLTLPKMKKATPRKITIAAA